MILNSSAAILAARVNVPTIIVGIIVVILVVLACYFTAKGAGHSCGGCSGNCKACKYAAAEGKTERKIIKSDEELYEEQAKLQSDNLDKSEKSENETQTKGDNADEKGL